MSYDHYAYHNYMYKKYHKIRICGDNTYFTCWAHLMTVISLQLLKPKNSMVSVIYVLVTHRHKIILYYFSYHFGEGYVHQK